MDENVSHWIDEASPRPPAPDPWASGHPPAPSLPDRAPHVDISASRVIAAPVAQVWAVLDRDICQSSTHPDLIAHDVDAKHSSGGHDCTVTLRIGRRQAVQRNWMLEYVPERRVAGIAVASGIRFRSSTDLSPDGSGTLVTMHSALWYPPSMWALRVWPMRNHQHTVIQREIETWFDRFEHEVTTTSSKGRTPEPG